MCKGLLHMWSHLLFVITWGQFTVSFPFYKIRKERLTKGNGPAKGSS